MNPQRVTATLHFLMDAIPGNRKLVNINLKRISLFFPPTVHYHGVGWYFNVSINSVEIMDYCYNSL